MKICFCKRETTKRRAKGKVGKRREMERAKEKGKREEGRKKGRNRERERNRKRNNEKGKGRERVREEKEINRGRDILLPASFSLLKATARSLDLNTHRYGQTDTHKHRQ